MGRFQKDDIVYLITDIEKKNPIRIISNNVTGLGLNMFELPIVKCWVQNKRTKKWIEKSFNENDLTL